MYKDDGEALTPLKPDGVEEKNGNIEITYNNVTLPYASLADDTNVIAAYKLFLDRIASLYATAVDPASGKTIKSNSIKIKVTLPKHLKGESGFKILTEDNLDESALGGSNFLKLDQRSSDPTYSSETINNVVTANPHSRNILNLILDPIFKTQG